MKLYLDSSTIVKRYVKEPGTSTMDFIFDQAENGELVVTFSMWNVGEVLGVLDERRRRGWLSEEEYMVTLKILSSELLKLLRLRVLEIFPVLVSSLIETWGIVLNYHVYEADALQITTYRYTKSDVLLSSDEKLIKVSRSLGLKVFDIVKEEQELLTFIKT